MEKTPSKAEDDGVRVVKVGHCPSLSGKSKLTYEIGSAGRGDVRIRIVGNSAPGTFDPSWVAMAAVESALAKCRKGEAVTAVVLDHLFRGRSLNTPFFLFAALKHEGLFKPAGDNRRGYERQDLREFLARVHRLLKSPQAADGASKAKKGKEGAAAARKAPQKSRS